MKLNKTQKKVLDYLNEFGPNCALGISFVINVNWDKTGAALQKLFNAGLVELITVDWARDRQYNITPAGLNALNN